MELVELIQPEFLLCELPIKDGSSNDDRIWVYHRLSLSLIEFVCLDEILMSNFKGLSRNFNYIEHEKAKPEVWKGIFVQNNTSFVDLEAIEVMDKAWRFLEDYLKWEYAQIDLEGDTDNFKLN